MTPGRQPEGGGGCLYVLHPITMGLADKFVCMYVREKRWGIYLFARTQVMKGCYILLALPISQSTPATLCSFSAATILFAKSPRLIDYSGEVQSRQSGSAFCQILGAFPQPLQASTLPHSITALRVLSVNICLTRL